MSQKTYPTPEVQWDRTVEVHRMDVTRYDVDRYGRYGLGWKHEWPTWHLGLIVAPHHLFVLGDVVIIEVWHGAMTRQRVWAYTSKGRSTRGIYLKCDTCYEEKAEVVWASWHRPGASYSAEQRHRLSGKPDGGLVAKRGRMFNKDHGPLRFIEHPRDLAGLPPDHADVRRYVVETLRAGDSATRVSADSPHVRRIGGPVR